MSIERLLLGTSNPAKIDEWKRLIGDIVELVPAEEMGIESPKEKGGSFKEIAENKAKYYAKKTKLFVLSEDGGFEIDAMDGLPGIKSRRILPGDKEGSDEDLISFVIKRLEGVPDEKRGARLTVHVVISDPEGKIVFEKKGSIEGRIPQEATSDYEKGYPYRAVLYVKEAGKIFSRFEKEDYEKHGHRKPIAESIREFLLEYDR